MYHSITIGTKNTWDDWHLIPSSRPLVAPPAVKTSFVEIPGGNGSLDLSEALAGKPLYNDRSGSWSFFVDNEYKDWTVLYSEIMAYLHGKKLKAVLEDDPAYYYEGRFAVNEWRSDAARSTIVINYAVGPYKKHLVSDENWLWDDFNFEHGTIRDYKNLVVDGSTPIEVINGTMETVPTFTADAQGIKVIFDGTTYALNKGVTKNNDIILPSGVTTLTFTGKGHVSIALIEGML